MDRGQVGLPDSEAVETRGAAESREREQQTWTQPVREQHQAGVIAAGDEQRSACAAGLPELE